MSHRIILGCVAALSLFGCAIDAGPELQEFPRADVSSTLEPIPHRPAVEQAIAHTEPDDGASDAAAESHLEDAGFDGDAGLEGDAGEEKDADPTAKRRQEPIPPRGLAGEPPLITAPR